VMQTSQELKRGSIIWICRLIPFTSSTDSVPDSQQDRKTG
jgi:hypothetical protein